jgi:endonuclease/exonuclease/phosphatase family metal-dependent hydrolase
MAKKKSRARNTRGGIQALVIVLVIALVLCVGVYTLLTTKTETEVPSVGTTSMSDTVTNGVPDTAINTTTTTDVSDTISVCSFNVQIFGVSKMSKPEVVDILVDIVSQADITAIQEVRSSSEESVLQFMEQLPPHYDYVLGPREGRSSSKEQYWIIYDANKLELIAADTWSDPEDIYERNPLGAFFSTRHNFDFIIIDNHIQPSGALAEITALPQVIGYYRDLWQETDILLVGDFNADGSYYNEALLENTFPPTEYAIIIDNDVDTTVAASANTYDRFIITSTTIEDYTGNSGVIRFDECYDFSSLSIEPHNVSDHYPIWAEFRVNADTD